MANESAVREHRRYVSTVEKRERLGKYYDKTPVLNSLPAVGSVIRATKKIPGLSHATDPRTKDFEYEPLAFGKELIVRLYTQGIDAPLKPNNFCICSYTVGDSCSQTLCLRTVDLALGLVEVEQYENREIATS